MNLSRTFYSLCPIWLDSYFIGNFLTFSGKILWNNKLQFPWLSLLIIGTRNIKRICNLTSYCLIKYFAWYITNVIMLTRDRFNNFIDKIKFFTFYDTNLVCEWENGDETWMSFLTLLQPHMGFSIHKETKVARVTFINWRLDVISNRLVI